MTIILPTGEPWSRRPLVRKCPKLIGRAANIDELLALPCWFGFRPALATPNTCPPRTRGTPHEQFGNSVTFTWTFTARHRTADYEYYVGGNRVAVIDGNDEQPPDTVSHTVDLGGVTGRQKVLAVWNIADTGNAYYACVDVEVR